MKSLSWYLSAVVIALQVTRAVGAVLYVDLNSSNSTPPFATWGMAATNIQDAIDVAAAGDLVLVTNGVYGSGGRVVHGAITNRVALTKPLVVQSVNGPDATVILGRQIPNQTGPFGDTNGFRSVRCAYVTNAAVLSGFTLTNGGTWFRAPDARDRSGGGVWCETNAILSNCTIVSNVAVGGSGGGGMGGSYFDCTIISNSTGLFAGGGVAGGYLSNCIVNGNASWFSGGGVAFSTAINCSLTGNSTGSPDTVGGGAYASTLNNCILVGNSARTYGGGVSACTLTNCVLRKNVATSGGGGSHQSQLYDCMVISNSAAMGGGAWGGTLLNCTLGGNQASPSHGGGAYISTLENCLIENNSSGNVGGGATSCSLIRCTLVANHAFNGGGIAGSSAFSCLVASNTAGNFGGGAFASTLTNCTLVQNSANTGGGMAGGGYPSLAYNCISFFNTAPTGADFDETDLLFFSCTGTLPASGTGNITNAPLFVDQMGGNFRLQPGSSCIDSGTNVIPLNSFDRDGRPRIVNGIVDIGAYEFQPAASGEFIAWLAQQSLPTDGSGDSSDADADGANNWQEWKAGTIPTDNLSVFKMLSPTKNGFDLEVGWQSVSGKNYFLQRNTNFTVQLSFSTLQSNIVGQAGTTVFADSTATNGGPYFYRVGVW